VAHLEVECPIDVRRATEADLSALVAALEQREFFADRLRKQAERRGVLLAAWDGGEAVGDVYLRVEPPDEVELQQFGMVPLLTHLEVLPAYRKQGVGTRLMEAAEGIAQELGFTRIILGVTEDNTDAIRLYRKRGYELWRSEPIKTYREVYQPDGSVMNEPDDPCLVFCCELTPGGRVA
jgi:ribosomal protein S18 acetylase RimI-like enzyme